MLTNYIGHKSVLLRWISNRQQVKGKQVRILHDLVTVFA